MGLLLSILIVCVGVIEALSCYDHFQCGVLNRATSACKTARRRSSALLKYSSRKLGFSFEEPVIENDEESDKYERLETNTRQIPTSGSKTSVESREKKLDKEEKIEIVKKLFESSIRPKPMRSISSPGLIYTRKDMELTNIINDLASETIDELNAEDSNVEVLTAEFDKLFNEYEKSEQNVRAESSTDIFRENELKIEADDKMDADKASNGKESLEMEIINFEKDGNPLKVPLSKYTQEIINGTASVDFDKLIYREIDKSTSGDVDSGDFSKICTRPPTHDSFPIKSSVPQESTSRNELADGIFESERDLDFVVDISGEIHNGSSESEAIFKEITKGKEIVKAVDSDHIDQRQVSNLATPKREVFSVGDDEELFLKAVEQLADLIVSKCLNKGMKTAVNSNTASASDDSARLLAAIQPDKKKDATDLATENLFQGNGSPNNDKEKPGSALSREKIQETDSGLTDDSNFGESLVGPESLVLWNPGNEILAEDREKMGEISGNRDSAPLGVEKPFAQSAIETGILEQSSVTARNGSETPHGFELGDIKMPESSNSDVIKDGDGNTIPECKYVLPVEMEKPDLCLTADLVKSPEEKHQMTFFDQLLEPQIASVDYATPHESSESRVKPNVILALEYLEKPQSSLPNEEALSVDGNTVQEQPVEALAQEPREKLQDSQNDDKQSKEANSDSRADFPDSKKANVSGLNTGKVFDSNPESVTSPQSNLAEDLGNDNDRRLKSRSEALDGGGKEASSSACEAFWLIFSGEYTKAMSKDWHSGHFSCWQCDEALTGQRYVLRDDHPYCIKCYESVFANVCEECNKIIGIDSKDLSYKDKHWHEACFLCNKCRVSLVDKQFGSKAEKIYCGNCYDAQFASRCDGCGEIFRAGTKKMEYKTRQWHEKCFCCCVCKTPIGTKSFIPREQEIYCATCYEEKFATRCVKCNKIITSGGVTYKNEPWHRECFTCTSCNTSLAGQRFTSRDEKPYCADCFGELFAKRCTACSRPITGIGGTRFISFENRHWHNDCFICASCKTSLVGRGFITDGDDIICPECAKQKLM